MPNKNSTIAEKLSSLRAEFNNFGVDGFIVPRADEYQGEYVAPSSNRLKFMTSFTGSAGHAIILNDRAVVMSDGRYDIQLKKQVDPQHYSTDDSTKITIGKWLIDNADKKAVIGYDPKLHTPSQIEAMEKDVAGSGITFKALSDNPVDLIWDDQPDLPMEMVSLFPDKVAGHSVHEKKKIVMDLLHGQDVQGGIITLPDSICWILNVRGNDVRYTPLVHSTLILDAANDKMEWFVAEDKVPQDVKAALQAHVDFYKPDQLQERMDVLARAAVTNKKPVMLDFQKSSIWFKNTLENTGASVKNAKDPSIDPKAQKAKSEQEAIRSAHVQDGVALVKFLKWLDDNASGFNLTEMDVVDQLEAFRQQGAGYKEPSFPTISGFADNGAIIHYRATDDNHASINKDGLLLVDSGAQYEWGTTDVTRTVAIGTPSDEMCENYTRVLKGHIGVSMAKFPEGTTGKQIDVYARQPLWDVGLDFQHGTGHGVGCYLSVHEEAGAGISPRSNESLKTGYFLSNEPGYYKEGEYGIRIENLVLVQEDGQSSIGKLMHDFETVTLAPYDRSLIKADMLSTEEKTWLNDYLADVYNKLESSLDQDHKDWLKDQTAPIL